MCDASAVPLEIVHRTRICDARGAVSGTVRGGRAGMLCTISAAREVGHEAADVPVHLYGPPGIADFLAAAMQLSDTYMLVPVLIHEFVAEAITGRSEDFEVCTLNPQ